MDRRVSRFPEKSSLTKAQLLDYFGDCPFLGCSSYNPIKDESKNMVVRTYFAINSKTKEEVVIKMVERGKPWTDLVANELRVHWLSYGHPYIAELKDVFLTSGYIAIVMKFVPGLDLDKMIGHSSAPLTEQVARRVFQQLLLAVKFLHDSGYSNRDIKVNNIIFDEETGGIALQDFMYSRHDQVNSDPREAFKGLPYTPPELLSGGSKEKFGNSANAWELGVCLFKMVTGKFPFEKPGDKKTTYSTVPVVIQRIATMDYTIPENLSESLKDLFRKIFVQKTSERILLEQICAHPWVNEEPWPYTPDQIGELMQSKTCPVDRETLENLIATAKTRDQRDMMTTRDTETLCDAVTDDVLLESSTNQRIEEMQL
jgi:serine/threonine protein kinase